MTHTATEGRAVRRALRRATSLTGAKATEPAVRTVANPVVVHIASHGYLDARSESPRARATRGLRDVRPSEEAPVIPAIAPTDHPMLRSAVSSA